MDRTSKRHVTQGGILQVDMDSRVPNVTAKILSMTQDFSRVRPLASRHNFYFFRAICGYFEGLEHIIERFRAFSSLSEHCAFCRFPRMWACALDPTRNDGIFFRKWTSWPLASRHKDCFGEKRTFEVSASLYLSTFSLFYGKHIYIGGLMSQAPVIDMKCNLSTEMGAVARSFLACAI